MVHAVAFPSTCAHVSAPVKQGARISLQLYIEKLSNALYPDSHPLLYFAGVLIENTDQRKSNKSSCISRKSYTCYVDKSYRSEA